MAMTDARVTIPDWQGVYRDSLTTEILCSERQRVTILAGLFAFSGWDMAERIKPLMGMRWEEGFDKPLDIWRRELNIELIGKGQNSWYEVPADLEL